MAKASQISLGQRLRAVRLAAGWTLKEMSRRSGIPLSTLSKVEHDRLTLSYPQLRRLAEKLDMPAADLFTDIPSTTNMAGWRSIVRGGDVQYETAGDYLCGYLCAELRQKRMKPVLIRIKATRNTNRRSEVCTTGDEFLYVLKGIVEVATLVYAPVVLRAGDSMYLDSRMAPSYTAVEGCIEATALLVCSETHAPYIGETGK